MDIDVNFEKPQLDRHQVLQKYTSALRQLRTFAERTYNISPFYFDNYVMFQYFQQRASSGSTGPLSTSEMEHVPGNAMFKLALVSHFLDRHRRLLYWIFYLLLATLCVFVYHHENSFMAAERSKTSFAGMRIWRRMTLPLIQRFPQLTELYDESCLMENPFFQIEELSCESCARVESVLTLTETAVAGNARAAAYSAEHVPLVFKIDQSPIDLDDFYRIYESNHAIFQRDAFRVQSTKGDVTNLEELFNEFNNTQQQQQQDDPTREQLLTRTTQSHNLWRCNRMLPARLLRQLFVSSLPNNGIALERFMSIDTAQAAAYTLPQTECANVYVQQALGTRYIILRPTSECRHKCRTLSLRLPQSFVLNYNWWYWRPISAPDPISEEMSISLIGSYC